MIIIGLLPLTMLMFLQKKTQKSSLLTVTHKFYRITRLIQNFIVLV